MGAASPTAGTLNLYNGHIRTGQQVRVFPLSNWTELDVWMYIEREALEVPTIYFAHERHVFLRSGMYLATLPYLTVRPDERIERLGLDTGR
jgi:sulfate adenylyltransferase subunit 2